MAFRQEARCRGAGSGKSTLMNILGCLDRPSDGRFFSAEENERKLKLVVLGYGIARDLFGEESPVGQTVTVGSTRMTALGAMEEKGMVADLDMAHSIR